MFVLKENQLIWDIYFHNIIKQWKKENQNKLKEIEWTDQEKEYYSNKIHGNIIPKNITPYKYEYKRKRMSVQQYKPIIVEFENYMKKSFDEVTTDDIEKFSRITDKKNKLSHLNAFLLNGIKTGIIRNRNKELLISLLPDMYQEIGEMISTL